MSSLTLSLANVVLRSDIQLRLDNLLTDLSTRTEQAALERLREVQQSLNPQSFDAFNMRADIERREASLGDLFWYGWKVTGPTGIEDSLPYGKDYDPPADLIEGSTDCWLSRKSGNRQITEPSIGIAISLSSGHGTAKITAPREELQAFADDARTLLDDYVVTPAHPSAAYFRPPFRIFIAYGGGHAWEIVRDYLRAEGFEVTAFTEEERASQLTLNVVSDMIRSATAAVIVMTGADPDENGAFRSRQNVVHEAGFAQGALGVEQTIILREAGVVLPTNLDGLTYIPFAQNEIHRTKDRVIARVRALEAASMGGC